MAVPTINFNAGTGAGNSTGNETTTTVVLTPNSEGDVVHIAMVSDAATQTFTFPAGFSKLYDAQVLSALSATLARKTAASESGSYAVTLGTSERQCWVVWSVSGDGGVHASATANTGTSATATCPAITTTVNDCLLFRLVATDTSAITSAPTNDMAGAGWTELATQIATSSGAISVYSKPLATAGAEIAASVTLFASDQWWATTFAIAPAAPAATERSRPNIRPIRSMTLPLPYLRI